MVAAVLRQTRGDGGLGHLDGQLVRIGRRIEPGRRVVRLDLPVVVLAPGQLPGRHGPVAGGDQARVGDQGVVRVVDLELVLVAAAARGVGAARPRGEFGGGGADDRVVGGELLVELRGGVPGVRDDQLRALARVVEGTELLPVQGVGRRRVDREAVVRRRPAEPALDRRGRQGHVHRVADGPVGTGVRAGVGHARGQVADRGSVGRPGVAGDALGRPRVGDEGYVESLGGAGRGPGVEQLQLRRGDRQTARVPGGVPVVDVTRRGVRARVVRTDLDRLLVGVVTGRVRARLGVGGGPAVGDGRVDGDGEDAVGVLQPGVVERDPQRVVIAVPHEGGGHVVGGGRVTGAPVDLRVVGVRRRDALHGLPGGVAQDDRAVLVLDRGESLEVEREGPGVAGVRRVQDDRFLHAGGGGGDLEIGVGEDVGVGDARAVGGALDGLGTLQPVGDGVLFVRGEGDERGGVGGGREVDADGVGLLVPPPVGTGPHIHVDGRPFALADLVVDRCGRDLSGDGPVGVVVHAVRTRGLGRVPLAGLGVEARAAGGAFSPFHGRLVRVVRGEFAPPLARLAPRALVRLGGGGGDMVLLPRCRARLLPRQPAPVRVLQPGRERGQARQRDVHRVQFDPVGHRLLRRPQEGERGQQEQGDATAGAPRTTG